MAVTTFTETSPNIIRDKRFEVNNFRGINLGNIRFSWTTPDGPRFVFQPKRDSLGLGRETLRDILEFIEKLDKQAGVL